MTVCVALACEEGIVLASDTRTTRGDWSTNDTTEKVVKLDSKSGLLLSSQQAGFEKWLITAAMIKQSQSKKEEFSISQFMQDVRTEYEFYYKDIGVITRASMICQTEFLIGTVAYGKPDIILFRSWSTPSFIPEVQDSPQRFVIGIPEVSFFIFKRLESDGIIIEKLSLEELKKLAALCVIETGNLTPMVHGLQIATITIKEGLVFHNGDGIAKNISKKTLITTDRIMECIS
jgi:predicted proteasome-type protease